MLAAPWAEGFAEEEDEPDDGPEAERQYGEEEVAVVGQAGPNECALGAAMGTVRREARPPQTGILCLLHHALCAFISVRIVIQYVRGRQYARDCGARVIRSTRCWRDAGHAVMAWSRRAPARGWVTAKRASWLIQRRPR